MAACSPAAACSAMLACTCCLESLDWAGCDAAANTYAVTVLCYSVVLSTTVLAQHCYTSTTERAGVCWSSHVAYGLSRVCRTRSKTNEQKQVLRRSSMQGIICNQNMKSRPKSLSLPFRRLWQLRTGTCCSARCRLLQQMRRLWHRCISLLRARLHLPQQRPHANRHSNSTFLFTKVLFL